MDNKLKTRLSRLKLLALDVDGVLTDGKIYFSETGDEMKAFNVKDGEGIKQLIEAGVQVAILTGRSSKIVQRRAKELGIKQVQQGVQSKLEALKELCLELGLTSAECAYMGDDIPDLSAMNYAGISFTVRDALPEIANASDWSSRKAGGEGAVREACEIILKAIKNKNA